MTQVTNLAVLSVVFLLMHGSAFGLSACQIDGFDITNLTLASRWVFDLPDSALCINDDETVCHFFFAFCKTLPDAVNTTCVNSSVCQVTLHDINEIGHYNDDPFTPKEVNGFLAKFTSTRRSEKLAKKSESNKINAEKNCTSISVTFEFDCNKDALWIPSPENETAAPQPKFLNLTLSNTNCDYYIQFDYAGACHRIQPTTTTTTTAVAPSVTSSVSESTSFYNPTPSKLCVPPTGGYDIANLTRPPFWTFNIHQGCALETNSTDACSLYIAFCKPIENVVDCDGAGSCLRYPNQPGSTVIVGNYTADPFTSFAKDGFESKYPDGVLIYNRLSQKYCYVSLKVKFQCDPNADWEVPEQNEPGLGPAPLLFEPITATSCELKMTVPYSGACTQKNKGLSTGSILVLIFFITLSVYLLVGICYNSFVANKSGAELIPHFSLWSAIFLFALDGLFLTWRFITCKGAQTDKLYDQI